MNIAAQIQARRPAGRNHNSRVVFLNNERPLAAGRCEVDSTDHRRLDEAVGGAEISGAGLRPAAWGPLRLRWPGLTEQRRIADGKTADRAQRHAFDGFGVSAVSIIAFMLI